MQFYLIFVGVQVVHGVLCPIKGLYLGHFKFLGERKMQHLGGEWRLCLLNQSIHSHWGFAFYCVFYVAELLLYLYEALFSKLLISYLLERVLGESISRNSSILALELLIFVIPLSLTTDVVN